MIQQRLYVLPESSHEQLRQDLSLNELPEYSHEHLRQDLRILYQKACWATRLRQDPRKEQRARAVAVATKVKIAAQVMMTTLQNSVALKKICEISIILIFIESRANAPFALAKRTLNAVACDGLANTHQCAMIRWRKQ
jgi:hypothetical protein